MFPVLEVEVDDGAVVEQVGAVGVEFAPQLHLLQGRYQSLGFFHLIFFFGDIIPEDENHGDIDIRLYFLRVDLLRFVELGNGVIKLIAFISQFYSFCE